MYSRAGDPHRPTAFGVSSIESVPLETSLEVSGIEAVTQLTEPGTRISSNMGG